MPFFDMGLSLFSDTREAYPLEEDVWTCRAKIHAKPFERDFDEQLDAAELLCGDHLRFTLPAGRIADVVGEPEGYEKEELARVREVLHVQAGKYRYFLQNSTDSRPDSTCLLHPVQGSSMVGTAKYSGGSLCENFGLQFVTTRKFI